MFWREPELPSCKLVILFDTRHEPFFFVIHILNWVFKFQPTGSGENDLKIFEKLQSSLFLHLAFEINSFHP